MTRYDRALRDINKARVALGKPEILTIPPEKNRSNGEGWQCPVRRALGPRFASSVLWGSVLFRSQASATKVAKVWGGVSAYCGMANTTPAVLAFIAAFDAGKYPALTEKKRGLRAKKGV